MERRTCGIGSTLHKRDHLQEVVQGTKRVHPDAKNMKNDACGMISLSSSQMIREHFNAFLWMTAAVWQAADTNVTRVLFLFCYHLLLSDMHLPATTWV